mmetsp:Transcript_4361/g.10548  ORF Transcript_4361/g.10548 Transcript_4361/m.10548 type:complete len:184 (-) Transcript_4361:1256-1807(-)
MLPETTEAVINAALRMHLLREEKLVGAEAKEALIAQLAELEESLTVADVETLVQSSSAVLERCARRGASAAQLEGMLKQEEEVSADQVEAYVAAWRKHEAKISEAMRARSFFGTTLQRISWRVDVASKSRHIEDISEPCTIVELEIAPPRAANPEIVRFEMDRDSLASLQGEVSKVRALLTSL